MKKEFNVKSGNDPICGYVAILPDSYSKDKKYPVMMIVHGIGERSDGSLSALKYLVEQQSWGGYIIPVEAQKATDLYNIIILVPNYSGDFNPDKINWVFDDAIKKYSVDQTKLGLTGFSLGGGAVLRYISSSQSNADRLAVAIPVAPVAWFTAKTLYVKNSGLPVWFHVNTKDTNGPTNLNVTLAELKEINDTVPPIPAIYTAYLKEGHGGQENAWNTKPPKAPGGQGYVDATIDIYQWLLANTNTKHVPVNNVTPVDPTPVEPEQPVELKSVAGVRNANGTISTGEVKVSSPNVKLDGTLSSKEANSYSWSIVSYPKSVNMYSIFTSGSGWIDASVRLQEGEYIFSYKISDKAGNTAISTVKVIYSTSTTPEPEPVKQLLQKVFIPKNNNYIYIYDDGSTETKSE